MKFISAILFITLLSLHFNLIAQPILAEDLEKVNAYLCTLATQANQGDVTGGFTGGEEENGVITGLAASFTFGKQEPRSALNLSLKMTGNIEVKIGGTYYQQLTMKEIFLALDLLSSLHKKCDQQGYYHLSSQFSLENVDIAMLNATLYPLEGTAKASIQHLTVGARTDISIQKNEAEVSGVFNIASDTVREAQVGLTGLFNALREGKEPQEEDLFKVSSVFLEIVALLNR